MGWLWNKDDNSSLKANICGQLINVEQITRNMCYEIMNIW